MGVQYNRVNKKVKHSVKLPKEEVQRGWGVGGGSPDLSPKVTMPPQDGELRWRLPSATPC